MQGSGLINQSRADGVQPEVNDDSINPIIVNTVLNISKDTMAYWQNMTCLFNKWWFPEPDRITFPFCFFHIVKYSEVEKAETSQKRVILYEPPEITPDTALNDPVRQGLMQTIVDNVVLQPSEIKIEAIVPFMPFGRFVNQGIALSSILKTTLAFFGSDGSIAPESATYIDEQLRAVYGTTGFATNAERAYDGQNVVMASLRDLGSGDNMINKNSLDAMFRRGNILQLKTWMGFDYKYVIIVDKTAEKRSTEDDVWRVALTLRELPVLSLRPVVGRTKVVDRAWMLDTVNKYGTLLGQTNTGSQMPYYRAIMDEGGANDADAQ